MAWQPNKPNGSGSNGQHQNGQEPGGRDNNVYNFPKRAPQPPKEWPVSPSFLGLAASFLIVGAIMYATPQYARGAVFPFVVAGWLISLCLHEFGHAITSYRFGDNSVRDRGYLTLDVAKYADPFNSILFPLLVLALGGLGLPGGAVFVEKRLLRYDWQRSAVSAAGPIANLLCLLALAAIIHTFSGALSTSPVLMASLNFLAFLQLTAIIFNLLPIPGLDGWGIIEPYLPYHIQESAMRNQALIFMAFMFVALAIPQVFSFVSYWAWGIMNALGLFPRAAMSGYQMFQFWR